MKANMWQFLQTYVVNSNWKKRHRNTSGNFSISKMPKLSGSILERCVWNSTFTFKTLRIWIFHSVEEKCLFLLLWLKFWSACGLASPVQIVFILLIRDQPTCVF